MSTKDTKSAAADQPVSCPREDFEHFMLKRGYSETTRTQYLQAFKRFTRSLPHNDPARATVPEAKRHIAELKRLGKSRSVTGNAGAALRLFFERMRGREWNPMSPLRRRMIEVMQLHSFSERTQQSYVRSVLGMAKYYDRSPELITPGEIHRYFVHLTCERKLARPTITIALCGIKFFWEKVLEREWSVTGVPTPKREKRLPVVLSRKEVLAILAKLRVLRHRACLTLCYCCGLRLQEVCNVRVTDIDRDRGLLHVRGKGSKDRYVPLPPDILPLLEQCWRSHKNPVWLFPWVGRGALQGRLSAQPVPKGSVQQAFRKAYLASGVRKKATVHTLRHCYATHLLEAKVDLRQIQEWLGHSSAQTTTIYAHLTQRSTQEASATLCNLMSGLAAAD